MSKVKTENETNFLTVITDVKKLPEIINFEKSQKDLVKNNPFIEIVDYVTYKLAKERRTNLVKGRTGLTKGQSIIKKAVTTKAKNIVDDLSKVTSSLIDITLNSEEKQQEEVTRWENLIKAKKQAKIDAEKKEREELLEKIKIVDDAYKSQINNLTFETIQDLNLECELSEIDDSSFTNLRTYFKEVKDNLIKAFYEKKQQLYIAETQRLETERIEAENKRLEALRLENERIENERKERIAKEDAERKKRIEAEDKARAEKQAKIDAENEAKAKVIAEKQVKIDAENKRQAEAKAKKEQAEKQAKIDAENEAKAKAEAEEQERKRLKNIEELKRLETQRQEQEKIRLKRIEKLKPEKQKLKEYIESIKFAIDKPIIKDKELIEYNLYIDNLIKEVKTNLLNKLKELN